MIDENISTEEKIPLSLYKDLLRLYEDLVQQNKKLTDAILYHSGMAEVVHSVPDSSIMKPLSPRVKQWGNMKSKLEDHFRNRAEKVAEELKQEAEDAS